LTSLEHWIDIGSTNRWRLHDSSLQSRTLRAGGLHYQYRTRGYCTAVAALNMSASNMRVQVLDVQTYAVLYDKSVLLVAGAEIANWYDYFYKQVQLHATDRVFDDLPTYPN